MSNQDTTRLPREAQRNYFSDRLNGNKYFARASGLRQYDVDHDKHKIKTIITRSLNIFLRNSTMFCSSTQELCSSARKLFFLTRELKLYCSSNQNILAQVKTTTRKRVNKNYNKRNLQTLLLLKP